MYVVLLGKCVYIVDLYIILSDKISLSIIINCHPVLQNDFDQIYKALQTTEAYMK